MNCQDNHRKMIDYVEGLLPVEDAKILEQHILSCKTCKEIEQETTSILQTIHKVKPVKPSDGVRTSFLEMLDQEKQLQDHKVKSFTTQKTTPWKTLFQIAASVLLLIGGYTVGTFQQGEKSNQEIAKLQKQTTALKQDMMLALLENRSVSKRIQAVGYSEEIIALDAQVMEALIDRLHFDGSINVRLAAAQALSKYSENEQVKNAFIKSLTEEKNPNIQIAVIQFLVNVQEKRALAPMQQLLEQTETPAYVKEQLHVGLKQII